MSFWSLAKRVIEPSESEKNKDNPVSSLSSSSSMKHKSFSIPKSSSSKQLRPSSSNTISIPISEVQSFFTEMLKDIPLRKKSKWQKKINHFTNKSIREEEVEEPVGVKDVEELEVANNAENKEGKSWENELKDSIIKLNSNCFNTHILRKDGNESVQECLRVIKLLHLRIKQHNYFIIRHSSELGGVLKILKATCKKQRKILIDELKPRGISYSLHYVTFLINLHSLSVTYPRLLYSSLPISSIRLRFKETKLILENDEQLWKTIP